MHVEGSQLLIQDGIGQKSLYTYDGASGRLFWLTRDPAGFIDGPNLYAYVQHNPWTYIDPHGLEGFVFFGLYVGLDDIRIADEWDNDVYPGFSFKTGNKRIKAIRNDPGGVALGAVDALAGTNFSDGRAGAKAGREITENAVLAASLTTRGAGGRIPRIPSGPTPAPAVAGGSFTSVSVGGTNVLIPIGLPNVIQKNGGEPGKSAKETSQESAAKAKSNGGPYSHLKDHPSVGAGKDFTTSQKKKILSENEKINNGVLRDDVDGTPLVRAQQHKKGVTPPGNEAHIDHVTPRSKGGPNSFSNAHVRSRKNNIEKSDKEN